MAELLERDDPLVTLAACARDAAEGRGGTVLVSGEAGIGKTSLLESFGAGLGAGRVLWGGCESLATPRPLGPLHDIAAQAGAPLRSLLARPHDRTARVRRRARRAGARADADRAGVRGRALGRRGDARPGQVHRPAHPARAGTAGAEPPRRRCRARQPARGARRAAAGAPDADRARPLSRAAVVGLAARRRATTAPAPCRDRRQPVLRHRGAARRRRRRACPATVRDAVLGRAAQLGARPLEVLQLAAIVPRAIDLALVADVLAPATEDIEACLRGGLLLAEGGTLRFRHELARTAVEESILPPRALRLHAQVLAALSSRVRGSATLAQLAHHAQRAGDVDAVVRWAPQAAREAASRGAQREAAAHCRAALAMPTASTTARTPRCSTTTRRTASSSTTWTRRFRRASRRSRSTSGRATPAGNARRSPRTPCCSCAPCAMPTPTPPAERAIALAEPLPPGRAARQGLCDRVVPAHAQSRLPTALDWGEKAIALAERCDDARPWPSPTTRSARR